MNSVQMTTSAVSRTRSAGLVLACVSVCTVLVVGLVAATNLAVPMLAASPLHPDSAELLWIVDSYVVVFACLVIPGGAAGDRFGRKGVLLAGLAAFAAGAIIAAVAPNIPVLLAGRAVSGLGAALVLPNCIGVLVHAMPPARRTRALATWAVASGMGGILGNTGGAALLTIGSWRTLFGAVAVIAVACAIWVARIVPTSSRNARSLDPAGTVLFVSTTVALLIGIIEGPEQGWRSPLVVSMFVLSILLAAAWVITELRVAHPLLDPRLFRIPLLSSSSLGMLVTFFGSFGLFFLNASLLQYGRGYSVLQAGFGTLPLALPMLFLSRLVPGLIKRIGTPVTLAAAFVAISGGLFGLSTAGPYLAYAAWLVDIGVGLALALPSLTAGLMAAMPSEQAGVAGGLQSATRELGSALGVAVVGTIASSGHDQVVDAFTAGAHTALRVVSIVTLLAGAVVVAVALRATARDE
jgi:MFS family permease